MVFAINSNTLRVLFHFITTGILIFDLESNITASVRIDLSANFESLLPN